MLPAEPGRGTMASPDGIDICALNVAVYVAFDVGVVIVCVMAAAIGPRLEGPRRCSDRLGRRRADDYAACRARC